MSIPFFYTEEQPINGQIHLNEESSRHITQVLRMESGERICLTDGLGMKYDAVIVDPHKKRTIASVLDQQKTDPPHIKTAIGISLLKNASRFEWFIEKATEMGIGAIIPLLCERTEKKTFRMDRMRGILISAMLQSQQTWLPVLTEPEKFSTILRNTYQMKLIAHCEDRKDKRSLKELNNEKDCIVLIGPEGDFSTNEIDEALRLGYQQVSLGNKRLRTETAGLLAAAYLTQL